MFKEIIEEGQDFFEDIFEHLFEHDESKKKKNHEVVQRTKLAYMFTQRVDNLIKIVFGVSILISAIIASVWGFTAAGDMVKILITSLPGRTILIIIGVSYIVNGIWRLFHARD